MHQPRDSSAHSPRTGVLIVAGVRLYREGLAGSLATCPRLAVLGTCSNRADACERVQQLCPDVVVVDVAIRESLELIGDLRAAAPRCKVLAFAVDENAADVIECAEAGAAGYVSAEASVEDLVIAIEGIARAELVCSPRIAAQLFGRISRRDVRSSVETRTLTSREWQVLDCLRHGKSNKEIAQALNIAEPTVKNHVHHLLEKLDVTTRAQAVAHATLSSIRHRGLPTRATR